MPEQDAPYRTVLWGRLSDVLVTAQPEDVQLAPGLTFGAAEA